MTNSFQKNQGEKTQFQKDMQKIKDKKKLKKQAVTEIEYGGSDEDGRVDGDVDAFVDWDDADFVKRMYIKQIGVTYLR